MTVTSVGGYSGTVSLACGVRFRSDLTCSFSSASLAFTGTNGGEDEHADGGDAGELRFAAGACFPGAGGFAGRRGIGIGRLGIVFSAVLLLTLLWCLASGVLCCCVAAWGWAGDGLLGDSCAVWAGRTGSSAAALLRLEIDVLCGVHRDSGADNRAAFLLERDLYECR